MPDVEGVCAYYAGDQQIIKVKSLQYLKLHAFRSECGLKPLAELFYTLNCPSFDVFYTHVLNTFDFECAQLALSYMNTIYAAWKCVEKTVDQVTKFVEPLRALPRKDAAARITSTYTGTLVSLAFDVLSNKPREKTKAVKQLLDQALSAA